MASNQITVLARGTVLRGDLFSQDLLILEGGVQGNVVANRVVIKGTGWVRGNLNCRSLTIELGGVVDGQVQVTDEVKAPQMAATQNASLNNQGQKALAAKPLEPPEEA